MRAAVPGAIALTAATVAVLLVTCRALARRGPVRVAETLRLTREELTLDDRRTAVAGLADFRLQQNVLALAGGGEQRGEDGGEVSTELKHSIHVVVPAVALKQAANDPMAGDAGGKVRWCVENPALAQLLDRRVLALEKGDASLLLGGRCPVWERAQIDLAAAERGAEAEHQRVSWCATKT